LGGLMKSSVLGDDSDVDEDEAGGSRIDLTRILARTKQNGATAKERKAATQEDDNTQAREARPTAGSAREKRRKVAEKKAAAKGAARRRKKKDSDGASSGLQFSPGQHIRHPQFGRGVVVKVKGKGEDTEITVAFPDKGVKTLMPTYVPIEKV